MKIDKRVLKKIIQEEIENLVNEYGRRRKSGLWWVDAREEEKSMDEQFIPGLGLMPPEARRKVRRALSDGDSNSSARLNPLDLIDALKFKEYKGNVDRGYYARERKRRRGANKAAELTRHQRRYTAGPEARMRGQLAHEFGAGGHGQETGMTGGYTPAEPMQTFGDPAAKTKRPKRKKRYRRVPVDLESALTGGKTELVPIDENAPTMRSLPRRAAAVRTAQEGPPQRAPESTDRRMDAETEASRKRLALRQRREDALKAGNYEAQDGVRDPINPHGRAPEGSGKDQLLADYEAGRVQRVIKKNKAAKKAAKEKENRLGDFQAKAERSLNENDITKADLKKVIREELEAFLDEYYNN